QRRSHRPHRLLVHASHVGRHRLGAVVVLPVNRDLGVGHGTSGGGARRPPRSSVTRRVFLRAGQKACVSPEPYLKTCLNILSMAAHDALSAAALYASSFMP